MQKSSWLWITTIALLCLILLPYLALAQDGSTAPAPAPAPAPAAPTGPASQMDDSFWGLVKASGFIGYIIIALSFVALAFIIEDFMTLQTNKLIPPDLLDDIEKLLSEEAYEDALETCNSEPCLLGNMFTAALGNLDHGFEEMKKAASASLEEETVKLQQKISWLQLLAAIAPMLGLLGTVWGMILAFGQIARMAGPPQPKDLAFGIYQALMTTYLGLIVAISCMVCYFYLRNRVVRVTMELAALADDLLARFRQSA